MCSGVATDGSAGVGSCYPASFKRAGLRPSSKIVANDLFLSSDSEVESPAPAAAPTPASQEKKRKSYKPVEKPAVKKPKIHIAPIKPPARITAQDLFNSGSEEEVSVCPA
ncbi:hypothetical protein ACJJTC_011798 [Scirpophaga incertulas]